MRKKLSKVSSVLMSVVLVFGTFPKGGGIFSPMEVMAAESEETLITDSTLGNYFNTVTENTVSVHDPSIIVGEDKQGEKCYYIFGSHMAWAKSYDLENWTLFTNNINVNNLRNVLPEDVISWSARGGIQESPTGSYEPDGNMWAPDVIYNKALGKWCMYMSVNGDYWYSSIIMLTADSLEGDWTYEGTIVYSGITSAEEASYTDYSEATGGEFDDAAKNRYNQKRNNNITYSLNAIDPCVFYDEDGTLWMSYGSWFGGIYLIQLDSNTGLRDYTRKYALTDNESDPYLGIKIAGGNGSTGEGSYIQYIDGYYYLFVSYGGFVANGGYNMRVFRSKAADGPYTDVTGDNAKYSNSDAVAAANTGNGTRLMTYYKWSWWQNAHVAQGHNSAFTDDDGKSYVIYHTRTDDGTEGHYVRVHQLFTTKSGYLTAAPFKYSSTDNTSVSESDIAGTYEVIMHMGTSFETLESVESTQITLTGDGKITGAYAGTWSSETADGMVNINIVINNVTYEGVMLNQTLEGTDVEALCFTSVGSNDVVFWGAKQPDDAVAVAAAATYRNTRESLPSITFGSLELPATSYFGTVINWKSSNEAVIASDGTYTQPEKDTDVVMTMEISKGAYTYQKSFTITAKAAIENTDDRYLVAEFLTDDEVDLSDGSSYSFANPFNSSVTPNINISNGVAIKFDTELKSLTPLALSNIIAFTGEGKLYFAGGSYLGYNATGGFFDANLKDYGIATDYIGTYNKVTVEIKLTNEGYAVYVNDKLAYTNNSLPAGTMTATLTDYSNVLKWLNHTADTLSLGTGNWWPDVIYMGTIGNIKLYAEPVEKETVDTSLYVYYEDYDSMTDTNLLASWPAVNLAGAVAKSDDHGKYFSFVLPGGTNSRGIATTFPNEANVGEGYSVSVDVQLTAGNGQTSEFAITSTDKVYNNKVINDGLSIGYIVDLKAGANTTTWTVNGTADTVVIPAGTWVNIKADILADGKVQVTIANGDNVLYTGTVPYNGNGIVGGIYLLDGRYYSSMAVDNIKVWDTSIDFDNQLKIPDKSGLTVTSENTEVETIPTEKIIESTTENKTITLADYDFTKELPEGVTLGGALAEKTDEGIVLSNGYINLPSDLFANLPDNADKLAVEITFSKQDSAWPESQWSERLFNFTDDDNTDDGVQTGTNGFGLSYNGNLGTTKHPYRNELTQSYLDGSLAGMIDLDNVVTVKAVLDFETNTGYVYLDDVLADSGKSADTITVADLKKFVYNNIGRSVDMWSMWGFMTVKSFSVSADYEEVSSSTTVTVDYTKETVTTTYSDGSELVVITTKDENGEVIDVKVQMAYIDIAVKTSMPSAQEGYSVLPAAEYVITNTGNTQLKNLSLTLENGTNFNITNVSNVNTLDVGESVSVTVAANAGIGAQAADYTDRLIVTADNADTQKVKIALNVVAKAEAGAKNPNPDVSEPETPEATDKPEQPSSGGQQEEESTAPSDEKEDTTEETIVKPTDVTVVDVKTEIEIIPTVKTETVTVNKVITLADYDFTKGLPDGVTLGGSEEGVNYEVAPEGVILRNGYINLPDNLFANLPDNTDKLTVEITFSKQDSAWPESQWSERLFNFTDDNYVNEKGEVVDGVQTGTNGLGLTYNGNLGTTKEPYGNDKAYFDGTLADKIPLDKEVTVKAVLDFKTNTGYVYLDGVLEGSGKSTDVITVADLKKFVYNNIGRSMDMWSMWGFMTVKNFSVSANYDTDETREYTVDYTRETVTTLYSDGSKVIVVTMKDENGNVLSKTTTMVDSEGNTEESKEEATTSNGTGEEEPTTPKGTGEEETTTPKGTGEEETTAPKGTGEEETTAPKGTGEEETTMPQETSDKTDDENNITVEDNGSVKVDNKEGKYKLELSVSTVFDTGKNALEIGIESIIRFTCEVLEEKASEYDDIIKKVQKLELEKKETIKEISVMDLNVTVNGVKVKYIDGRMDITMPIPDNMKSAERINVYRQEDDKSLTDLGEVEIIGDMLKFSTDHFSIYVFVERAEDTKADPIIPGLNEDLMLEENVSKTGDKKRITLLTFVMLAIASFIKVLKMRIKKIFS